MVAVDVELAEILAVVGTDQNDRLIEDSCRCERVEDASDPEVGVESSRVVAVEELAHFVHRIDERRLSRVDRAVDRRIVDVSGHFTSGVGPATGPVRGAHLFGEPGGKR